MAKKVFYDDDARKRVLGGAEVLYNAVKTTMGPKGRNVVISKTRVPSCSVSWSEASSVTACRVLIKMLSRLCFFTKSKVSTLLRPSSWHSIISSASPLTLVASAGLIFPSSFNSGLLFISDFIVNSIANYCLFVNSLSQYLISPITGR